MCLKDWRNRLDEASQHNIESFCLSKDERTLVLIHRTGPLFSTWSLDPLELKHVQDRPDSKEVRFVESAGIDKIYFLVKMIVKGSIFSIKPSKEKEKWLIFEYDFTPSTVKDFKSAPERILDNFSDLNKGKEQPEVFERQRTLEYQPDERDPSSTLERSTQDLLRNTVRSSTRKKSASPDNRTP